MKKLLIGGAIVALVVASDPSLAQSTPPPGVAQGTAPVAPARPAAPMPPAEQMRVRIMSDKVMTRADVEEHVRKLFARFDANHDGFITRDEIASAGKGMMAMGGGMPRHGSGHAMMMGDPNAMFDRLDTNHDGNISRQEFLAGQTRAHTERMIIMRSAEGSAAAGQPGSGMERVHAMHMRMGMGGFGGHLFEMADANHDGRVSLQEAEAAALSHFDRADLNHDGKLTPEERSEAHRLMRQHRAD